MTIKEGPAFGALLIGGGIGYLFFQKTQRLDLSIGVGVFIYVLDYVVLDWLSRFKKREK